MKDLVQVLVEAGWTEQSARADVAACAGDSDKLKALEIFASENGGEWMTVGAAPKPVKRAPRAAPKRGPRPAQSKKPIQMKAPVTKKFIQKEARETPKEAHQADTETFVAPSLPGSHMWGAMAKKLSSTPPPVVAASVELPKLVAAELPEVAPPATRPWPAPQVIHHVEEPTQTESILETPIQHTRKERKTKKRAVKVESPRVEKAEGVKEDDCVQVLVDVDTPVEAEPPVEAETRVSDEAEAAVEAVVEVAVEAEVSVIEEQPVEAPKIAEVLVEQVVHQEDQGSAVMHPRASDVTLPDYANPHNASYAPQAGMPPHPWAMYGWNGAAGYPAPPYPAAPWGYQVRSYPAVYWHPQTSKAGSTDPAPMYYLPPYYYAPPVLSPPPAEEQPTETTEKA